MNPRGEPGSALPDEATLDATNPIRLSLRSRAPGEWGPAGEHVLDPGRAAAARAEMRRWPAYDPTPLVSLPELAGRLGVSSVTVKDETGRFGIGSFKALGGAYAVLCLLQDEAERKTGRRPTARELLDRSVPGISDITTVTASAGNHGRSVAWGSELFGCECVVVLPAGTLPARAAAIESHGARVDWFAGDYDDAVAHTDRVARERGWFVVSDTAYAGYEEIPRRVYEGYTLLADEVLAAVESANSSVHPGGGRRPGDGRLRALVARAGRRQTAHRRRGAAVRRLLWTEHPGRSPQHRGRAVRHPDGWSGRGRAVDDRVGHARWMYRCRDRDRRLRIRSGGRRARGRVPGGDDRRGAIGRRGRRRPSRARPAAGREGDSRPGTRLARPHAGDGDEVLTVL